jgi:hypothetical protein
VARDAKALVQAAAERGRYRALEGEKLEARRRGLLPYDQLERNSRNTNSQTIPITSRLIAILSSIPRTDLIVGASRKGSSCATLTSSEAPGPPGCRPIVGSMLAHRQGWRPTIVRVALTILIVVALWAAFDPFGAVVFSAILVAVVWRWNR